MLKTVCKLFGYRSEIPPEDGIISAETSRRVLIIIHAFYCICAFC